MKKILSCILMAFTAALLLVPVAKAQTPDYVVDKYLTSTTPNANGEYTLRIETYATGSVENVISSSDIVLVLDMSGSMRYDYYSGYPNAPETLPSNSTAVYKEEGTHGTNKQVRYAYNRAFNAKFVPMQNENNIIFNTCYNALGGTARYYKHTNGTYYLVHQEYYNSKYYLYYKVGNTTYYLWDTGTTTTRPTGRTNPNPDEASESGWRIYTGNLYRYDTRLEVLQRAVTSFVSTVTTYSTKLQQAGKDPNRIAIVQFSGLSTPTNTVKTSDPGGDDHTYVRLPLTNLTTANASTVKTNVSDMRCKGETPVNAGMRQARRHLQVSGDATHNKFVVVFTDGEPRQLKSDNVTPAATWTNMKTHVTEVMDDANLIKRTSGLDGTIFAMGLGPTAFSKTFLQYLSSMYVDPVTVKGTNDNPTFTGTRNSDRTTKFYQDDATADFSAIFDEIAEHIVDAQSSVVNIDLVADSFKLPNGADASRVKVYTAQCTGKTGSNLTWGSLVAAPSRGNVSVWVRVPRSDGGHNWAQKTMDIDNSISIGVDTQNNKVTVGGFDYQTLWCGPDEAHGGYHGYKLVFDFPIVVKDATIGGIGVPTNLPSSGLYPTDPNGNPDLDHPIIKYPIPELDLPIKLIIQKSGLAKGESASFTIERKPISGSGSWTVFTSFILTGTGDSTVPEVRFLNLDPSFYYRIKETGWSWSYQMDPNVPSTETINPRSENPIIFTNTPKTTNVPKHAEAKSVNTMKETGSGQSTVLD